MMLENRVVVISGATGVLGRVVTAYMAQQGAKLALLGRTEERLANLIEEIGLVDENYLSLVVDLSDPLATSNAANAVIQKFGNVDILLQLVGGWTGGQTIVDVDPADVSTMLEQHVWTTFNLVQAFVPHLLKNEWGRIVAISSPFSAAPRAKGGPYAIGKAAQEALILTLAQELKGTSVTANILLVKTIDVSHQRELEHSAKNASWSTPDEIINAIFYLVSEDARKVNGARLPLYGTPQSLG